MAIRIIETPMGATLTVQDATFFKNAKTVLYDFRNEFNGNENGFYRGAPHSTNEKSDVVDWELVLPI